MANLVHARGTNRRACGERRDGKGLPQFALGTNDDCPSQPDLVYWLRCSSNCQHTTCAQTLLKFIRGTGSVVRSTWCTSGGHRTWPGSQSRPRCGGASRGRPTTFHWPGGLHTHITQLSAFGECPMVVPRSCCKSAGSSAVSVAITCRTTSHTGAGLGRRKMNWLAMMNAPTTMAASSSR